MKKTHLRPLSSRNSISEPDLATAGRQPSKSGFPPGTTVDELWLYRRKRPSANLWPQDHLHLLDGSFKLLKTEYKRRFKNYYDFKSCEELGIRSEDISPVRATKPDDTLKIEGSLELQPEYNESFIEYPVEKPARFKPINQSFKLIDSGEADMKEIPSEAERLLTEIKANVVNYPTIERRHLIKNPSNLRLEGDFCATTENAENFIEYLLTKRPDLARKPTTLKLEGEMEIKTETSEKFGPLAYQSRPPLCKKFTNLHLEGDLNILTEKQEKFVPYEVQKRPPLTKKSTNLHVEGELEMLPEYRREFIEYKTERRTLALPVNNLKTDGFYEPLLDVSKPFEQQIHPQIPFLRGTETSGDDFRFRSTVSARRREPSFKTDGPMDAISESRTQFVEKSVAKTEKPKIFNNLHLEGRIDLNPEYRNAYIDFNKDGRMSPTKIKSRRTTQQSYVKPEGKMETKPEYTSSYVDFPRERPHVKRPEGNLASQGEMSHSTEQNDQYVPFPNAGRTGSLKRESELKPEGEFECQPEYRKAYIDYLIRERAERKPRPLDNLGNQRKRAFEVESPVKSTEPTIHGPTNETLSVHVKTAETPEKLSDVLPVPPPPKPSSASSSVPSSPRSGTMQKRSTKSRSPRNRSLSQIETTVFGPKLTVPAASKSSSRSSSPASRRKSKTLPRSRHNSSLQTSTDSEVSQDKNRRFGNPVRVENLAYRAAPVQAPMVNLAARNKWMRDSSVESSSAFVVLDTEVNNNFVYGGKKGPMACRESKWMPSWNSSSY